MSIKILMSASSNTTAHKAYIDAINGAGGIAVAAYLPAVDISFDGLVLCGGSDVDPCFYGEDINGAVDIDHARDEREFALARAFIAAGKPVFGICRGSQVLNVFFGGTLHQHLDVASDHSNGKDYNPKHQVTAKEGSIAHKLYGESFSVNSRHHQAVKRLADGLRITMTAEDGTVEGFEHETRPIFAVQWHPEQMCFDNKRDDTVDGAGLFEHFISLCEETKRG